MVVKYCFRKLAPGLMAELIISGILEFCGLDYEFKLEWCRKGAMTFSIMRLSIMTFNIITLSIEGLFVTLSINDMQYN